MLIYVIKFRSYNINYRKIFCELLPWIASFGIVSAYHMEYSVWFIHSARNNNIDEKLRLHHVFGTDLYIN